VTGLHAAVVEASHEFKAFRERLTRRLDRAGREATDVQYRRLRSLWEAWDRAQRAWEREGSWMPPGVVGVLLPPPPWDELEDEFAPVAEPELEPAVDAKEDELRAEVAKRIADGMPTTGELTQNKIAQRVGVTNRQVARVEYELGGRQDKRR
jgi:hypothetical protein